MKKILLVTTLSILTAIISYAGTVASGSWTKKPVPISGKWAIIEINGKTILKLTGFKTKNAPDLKIFLSPKTLREINSKNATHQSVLISKLRSSRGNQTYVIPKGALTGKKTLIIHCEKYTKLWGGAPL